MAENNDKRTIVCFGPGPKFKGGIANYNTSLAKALDTKPNTDIHIVSWTQQYPSIIPREFVDRSSKKDLLEGTDIKVQYLTNYNKPWTWSRTAKEIAALKPDIVVIQWAIAIQGIPLGKVAKGIQRRSPNTEVIFDLHFVKQKENSKVDQALTKRGIRNATSYIVHAYKTYHELEELFPNEEYTVTETGKRELSNNSSKPVIKLYHPVYDIFQPREDFDVKGFKEQHGLKENVFLFFGFIRKYKGLHNAIKAFSKVVKERDDVSFLICGESFWNTLDRNKWSTRIKEWTFGAVKKLLLNKGEDEEKNYDPLALIKELGLEEQTMVVNEFIPNEDVHKYFQVSDASVLFYLTATPSGIESLSYNFKLPILATKVGHFPETITDGFNGYLAEDNDVKDMARVMKQFLDHPLPKENVEEATKQLSWSNYADAILNRSS